MSKPCKTKTGRSHEPWSHPDCWKLVFFGILKWFQRDIHQFWWKILRKSVVGLVILSALQPSKSGVRICSESLQRQGGATRGATNMLLVSFFLPYHPIVRWWLDLDSWYSIHLVPPRKYGHSFFEILICSSFHSYNKILHKPSQRIHVWYTHIWSIFMVNVGKYSHTWILWA